METEEEGQTQAIVFASGLGCFLAVLLVVLVGGLVWWLVTGELPGIGMLTLYAT